MSYCISPFFYFRESLHEIFVKFGNPEEQNAASQHGLTVEFLSQNRSPFIYMDYSDKQKCYLMDFEIQDESS